MMSRAEQIAALRQLLLVLEAHPEVEMPYNLGQNQYAAVSFYPNNPAQVGLIATALGGEWQADKGEEVDETYLRVRSQFAGELHILVMTDRKAAENLAARQEANDVD